MMKTKTSIGFAAAIAAGFAFGFAGCGGDGTMTPTTCSSDSQCSGAGEVCHPLLKTCVTGCSGSGDCPDSAKKCATITGASAGTDGGSRGFCQCATDNLCDRATTGQICQDKSTLVCSAKCTGNASCPTGFSCDTATGKCGAGSTDAGTDGGTAGVDAGVVACTPGTCASPQICNTGVCGAATTCAAPAFQPGTCPNGQQCSGTSCAEVPFAPTTCGNIAAGSTPRAWTPVNSNGPVITEVTLLDFMVDTAATPVCAGANSKRARLRIRAYDPSTPGRLTGETSQPSLRYYRTDTTSLPVTAAEIQSYVTENTGRNANFIVNLCFPTATTSASVGYAYDNGNPVCATVQ
jgi:hypothetical protein